MKFSIKHSLAILCFFSTLSSPAFAIDKELKPDQDIAREWNQFVEKLVKLHEQLIDEAPHDRSWRIGGYSNDPRFFDEATYTNKETGHVTSIVQWERRDPSAVHSIEVKLRDKDGRIHKDFTAAYLTKHRNAPIQTLITLHYYNKDLHGFRVFDASHNRIFEVCRGQFNGKRVNIDLDDDYGELSTALENPNGIMDTKAYKACFGSRKVDTSRLSIPVNF